MNTNITVNNKTYTITDTDKYKIVRGEGYNYNFDKLTGYFERWGKTKTDDPLYSPIGNEILDIEVTTSCKGPNGKPCPFCYKANTANGLNMSFETYRSILDKMPLVLTQVAFGADAQAPSNPDLFKMMEYTRSKGIIPNITVADITDDIAKKLANVCGAVAVSAYQSDKNVCYNSIKKLTDLGMTQINIHAMLSTETLPFVYEVLHDVRTDSRLSKLNAVVFLGVKQKGRAAGKFTSVKSEDFLKLIQYCFDNKLNFGFDSCSCPKFEKAVKQMGFSEQKLNSLLMCGESCESSAFSGYINVLGEWWHCSFSEQEPQWEGIDITKISNFLTEVWYNSKVIKFRNALLEGTKDGCRYCPTFSDINQ